MTVERAYIYDHFECSNIECGKRFEAKYQNTLYCSARCRTRHHRAKAVMEKKVKRILDAVEALDRKECRSQSVSEMLSRIATRTGNLADEWEFVRNVR